MEQHIKCPLLRRRLNELHNGGMTWARMQQKSDVNQTTISRFARGEAALEPASYHKLRNTLGKSLPEYGTPEHRDAVSGEVEVPPGAAEGKVEMKATVTFFGTGFHYDGQKLGWSMDNDYHELDLPAGTLVEIEVE